PVPSSHAPRSAQQAAAPVLLPPFRAHMRLTQATSRRLPTEAPVVQLDVTDADDLAALADRVREHTDRLGGVVHSIGFAPQSVMGGNFLAGEWPDRATALEVSAFSVTSRAVPTRPLLTTGAGVVGVAGGASVAWPVYAWMGVAKAAPESLARYLAGDLGPEGIRVNLVSAGPIRATAATSIPGFDQMEDTWDE